MKQIDGWWVSDRMTEEEFKDDQARFDASLAKALEYCQRPRVAVMAGDSTGAWTKKLAGIFRYVIAFQPDVENFECLVRNCEGLKNVLRLQAFLGHKFRPLELKEMPDGAHWAVGQGKIAQICLDKFQQHPFDLLMLNVAGWEVYCVEGCQRLIFPTCHPVVVYENHYKWKKLYGKKVEAMETTLTKAGYELKAEVGNDLIWDKKNKPVLPK